MKSKRPNAKRVKRGARKQHRLSKFEKKIAAATRKGRIERIENSPPLGFLPDGTFTGYLPDGPLDIKRDFKPKIIRD